jgi:hypothetical protein
VTTLFVIIETSATSFAYDVNIEIALAIECQFSTTIQTFVGPFVQM